MIIITADPVRPWFHRVEEAVIRTLAVWRFSSTVNGAPSVVVAPFQRLRLLEIFINGEWGTASVVVAPFQRLRLMLCVISWDFQWDKLKTHFSPPKFKD